MIKDRDNRRVLLTGGTGLLGYALQKTAPTGVSCFSTYYPERTSPPTLPFPLQAADVADPVAMETIFQWAQPNVVIHTAAIGSVDYAENNRAEAARVNLGGTRVIAELCERFRARLVYLSSNAVFDGRNPPYRETSPVNPINYYGQLKVEAEAIVSQCAIPWAIVRPILMYGQPYPGERTNPVLWWINSLREARPIRVVDNVFSKPLPAWSCAEVIWKIIQDNRVGLYHAAGSDHLSLYQFALRTAEVFGLDASLIEPVCDSFFPEIAPRPQDTSFHTGKMEQELGVKPVGVDQGLRRLKSEMERSHENACSFQ